MIIAQAAQKAVRDALVLALPGVAIYDHVTYAAAKPFGVLLAQDISDDDTIAQRGFRHTVTVQFYSAYRGQKEVLGFLDAAWVALHGVRLALETGRAVVCRCVSQHTSLDGDGLTRRGDLSVVLRTAT